MNECGVEERIMERENRYGSVYTPECRAIFLKGPIPSPI